MWLTSEFSSDRDVQQMWRHIHCDIIAAVMGSPADNSNLIHF